MIGLRWKQIRWGWTAGGGVAEEEEGFVSHEEGGRGRATPRWEKRMEGGCVCVFAFSLFLAGQVTILSGR